MIVRAVEWTWEERLFNSVFDRAGEHPLSRILDKAGDHPLARQANLR